MRTRHLLATALLVAAIGSALAAAAQMPAAATLPATGYSVLMPMAEPLPAPLSRQPLPVFPGSELTTVATRRHSVTLEPPKKQASSAKSGAPASGSPSSANAKTSGPPALLPVPRATFRSGDATRRLPLGW